MDDDVLVRIPKPLYSVGTTVIALVNYKPRVADILQAHLSTNIVVDETGAHVSGTVRWEYDVLVYHEDTSERMVISERTIIMEIEPEADEERPA